MRVNVYSAHMCVCVCVCVCVRERERGRGGGGNQDVCMGAHNTCVCVCVHQCNIVCKLLHKFVMSTHCMIYQSIV